ncbi:MAG: hypothetical protein IPI74_03590 [Bacteroidales bacterium]|nr:hypothetical protein [Bacteroidales bacterium]
MRTIASVIAFLLLTAAGPTTQILIQGTVTDSLATPQRGLCYDRGSKKQRHNRHDGSYSINAGLEAKVLVFFLRGMKEVKEPIMGRTIINVVLEPENTDITAMNRQTGKEKRTDQTKEEYVVMEDEVYEYLMEVVYDQDYAARAGRNMKSSYYHLPC